MALKIEKAGVIHYTAKCGVCDWEDAYGGKDDSTDRARMKAKRHTEKTGHTVVIESTTLTFYESDS